MSDELALLGGTPVIEAPLTLFNSIGEAERDAVARVMSSGRLSGFYGSWGEEFFGGPVVRAFEEAWAARFGSTHAVSVNSATSGLYAAMGAARVSPGDEVIVPPWTMSATVMAPLVYGGIPVFVDIDPSSFCLDPAGVRRAITPRTRAIIAVNLFGHPAALGELREIADAHSVVLIEDNAQSPLASESDRYCGTVGHIGVFSLNYHKHIHAGEGGVCVTDDAELALRLQLIRNHAESVVPDLAGVDLVNMVGFNYRMSEISAAIGIEQLKRADELVKRRIELAETLTDAVRGLDGIIPPSVAPGSRHVYYLWVMRLLPEVLEVSRTRFSAALAAEGFPHFAGYVRPLYLLPIFQQRTAIGRDGFPFSRAAERSYPAGLCPVAETAYSQALCFEVCMYDPSPEQTLALGDALRKVHRNRGLLREIGTASP